MAHGLTGADGARRPNQTIVLLADGTGNSSGALRKTNVWRLYQAVDLGPPPPSGRRQIVYYHDGVGTSSFKPLAVLGGAFGWGLKRNILDLYTFLCRNYTPGDRIYAFGFSRGAFTIRLLIGLVVSQGILDCSEEQLAYATRDAYRKYRYSFNQTGGLVGPLRWLRDHLIHAWRRLKKQTPYAAIAARARHPEEGIDFVGVWDTVSAYGMPVAEMTRGIDDWVWPLSMPNYGLSEKVKRARHALALDDERDTFHPLLWDEQHEYRLIQAGTVKADRLQQVWFAGMHSDVGGGYPDDALAHVPLDWMISEAKAAGLRFNDDALAIIERTMNESGPIHDSRRGVAGYYRYQPRKISARVEPRDPRALVMEDPDLEHGLLRSVHVHASVLNRIRLGADCYAPIVLPRDYDVVGTLQGPPETPAEAAARETQQEYVWNQVWRKRVTYFTTVAVSLLLAALPLIQRVYPPTACQGPQCLLAPMISALGVVLPGFARPWLDAFARAPGIFAIIVAALAFLLMRSENLQRRIRDDMHTLWMPQTGAGRPAFPTNWIYRLRTNGLYQRGLRSLKWKVVPAIFGWLVLAAGFAAIAAPVVVVAARVQVAALDRSNQFCAAAPATMAGRGQDTFDTRFLCWPTGSQVSADTAYRINVHVTKEWFDRFDRERIPASPTGFGPETLPWGKGYFLIPFRRSITNRWFQPLAKVISGDGSSRIYPLEMRRSDTPDVVYTGDFKPSRGGAVFLFVNDALVPWGGSIRRFYENNAGEARVWLTRVSER